MIYPEGLMHKKVNIFIALIVILIVAGIFAWIISARAFLPGIGLSVVSPPVPCVLDPCPGDGCAGFCKASCATCGTLPYICTSLSEVKATYLSGTNSLLQGLGGSALCVFSQTPPTGGSFRPGAQCIGNITGFGPHILQNFGCFN